MAETSPVDMIAFTRIEGVGEKKAVKYWKTFVSAIRKAKGLPTLPSRGASHEETLLLLNSNYSIDAISQIKGVSAKTIYGHVAQLIAEGRITDYRGLITREQYNRVLDVYKNNRAFMYLILAKEMPLGLPGVALAIAEVLSQRK